MKLQRKGVNLGNNAMKVVYGFLGIVLLLLLSAELLPEAQTAVESIGNISDLPLAGLFTAGGVVVMIIVIIIIVAVIRNAGNISK
jgi:hypothetical protein